MGAVVGTSLQACLNMVRPLETLVGNQSPQFLREKFAGISALTSPQNTAGLDTPMLISADGKTLKYQLDYLVPNRTKQTGAIPDFCGLDPTAAGTPKKSLDVTLSKGVYRNGKVEADTYRALCEGPVEIFSWEIMNAMFECIEDINIEIYETIYAACGDYSDAVDSVAATKTVNLLNDNQDWNRIQAGEALRVKREYDKFSTAPILLGGHYMKSILEINETVNPNQSINDPAMSLFGMAAFADTKMDEVVSTESTVTSNYLFSWAPGTFRFLTGAKNKGVYEEVNDPRTTKTTTNFMGVDFDIWTKYDPDCSEWIWQVAVNFDVVHVPIAEYPAGYIGGLLWEVGAGSFTAW